MLKINHMETIIVYSPIEDKKIKSDLNNSPIWKKANTEEEYLDNPRRYPVWFKYTFKFDGLKPVQLTKMKKISN